MKSELKMTKKGFGGNFGRTAAMLRSLPLLMIFGGGIAARAQIYDEGYLFIDGTTSPALTWSNEPQERFIWNSDKNQFTAGTEGLSSTTAGTYTFGFGERARAKGNYSVSFGYHIYSDAPYSFAAGQNVSIDSTADGSIALGLDLTIDGGSGAIALGDTITVDGDGAFAAGQNSSAEGWGSIALGYSSVVDLSSSTVAGAYAIGRGLSVQESDAFVVGKFNYRSSQSSDNYAFVVGNGADGANRADAFWVDASGNVGATGVIDITGGIETNGDLNIKNNAFVVSNAGTTNIDHIWHDESSAGGAGGTWNFVSDTTYKAAGNARLRAAHIWMTASGQNNYIAGNLGVGTSSPSAKLHVVGDVRFTGTDTSSHFNYSTNEDTYIRGGKTGAEVYVNDTHAGDVILATGGGNVGIGTASPQTTLDVQGDVQVSGESTFSGTVRLTAAQGDIPMGVFQ